jgi:hypothetical protein
MKTQVNIMMDISLTMSRLIGKSLSDWCASDFKKAYSKNSLDELKSLNQLGSVEKYWYQFEKLRSRMILEGRQFSKREFINAFISRLKGEIKSFVFAFKSETLKVPLNIDCTWRVQLRID